jgi:hypothetical protein
VIILQYCLTIEFSQTKSFNTENSQDVCVSNSELEISWSLAGIKEIKMETNFDCDECWSRAIVELDKVKFVV